jgi:hypothetical protein
MGREIETEKGKCDSHGAVNATREIPTISFPWIVNAVRRSLARRRPFVCPECGEPVDAA